MSRSRARLVAIAVAAIVAGGAGAAYAFWSSAGGGTGGADSGAVQPVTLSAGIPGSPLYPGAQVAVELTITNPNEGAVRIGSIALDTGQGTGGFDVDAGHAACDLSALEFSTQTNGGAGWDLPPQVGGTDGTLDVSLPAALSMATSAGNECQGATFTVFLEVGP